jgi:hypothetical protein
MNNVEILNRRIFLQRQAIPLIKTEIRQDRARLALLGLKGDLEAQMTKTFDPILSRKLDAVHVLLGE